MKLHMTWLAGATLGVVAVAVGVGRLSTGPAEVNANQRSATGTLVSTVAMSASRAAHTATALPDGRVLVAGGFVAKGSPNGAELYDADAGRFVPLPPMVTTRHSHTATLLPSGKVLIVGGYGEGSTTLAAAELFDPTTETFSPTGSLGAARADHVAVLLENGTVLIAGGLGTGWTYLASAELYDPATGQFSPTGSMTAERESHTGVRLPDARVLIAGGHHGPRANLQLLASAETYDPATGIFHRVGDLQVRRHKHDAVVLPNGHVLVTGGSDERDDKGAYRSSELFDPATDTFAAGPRMERARYKHANSSLVLPSGLVLIGGGAPEAETFDPRSGRFALVDGSPRMAGQLAAVARLPAGGALITGGYGNGDGPRSSAWRYRP